LISATIASATAASAQHLGFVDAGEVARTGVLGGLRLHRSELHDMRQDLDTELCEQQLCHGAGGDAGCGLPRGCALQHVTRVGEAVLLHARQVGMARPRLGQRRAGGSVFGGGRHLLLPLLGVALPFGVGDLDGDRRAQRAAVTDTRQQ